MVEKYRATGDSKNCIAQLEEGAEPMATGNVLEGKAYSGNPYDQFEEEEDAFVRAPRDVALFHLARKYKKRILLLVGLWGGIILWQLMLIFLMLGSFAFGMHPLGFISYVFTAGYCLCHITGQYSWGPMLPWDWQWVIGFLAMLVLSFLLIVVNCRRCRIVLFLLFLVLHIVGSVCTFINMGRAIT